MAMMQENVAADSVANFCRWASRWTVGERRSQRLAHRRIVAAKLRARKAASAASDARIAAQYAWLQTHTVGSTVVGFGSSAVILRADHTGIAIRWANGVVSTTTADMVHRFTVTSPDGAAVSS